MTFDSRYDRVAPKKKTKNNHHTGWLLMQRPLDGLMDLPQHTHTRACTYTLYPKSPAGV